MPPKLPLKRAITLENSIITSQEIQHLQFSADARTDHRSLITNHLLAPGESPALEHVVLYEVPVESRARLNPGKHSYTGRHKGNDTRKENVTHPSSYSTEAHIVSGRLAKLLHNLSFSLSSLALSVFFASPLFLLSLYNYAAPSKSIDLKSDFTILLLTKSQIISHAVFLAIILYELIEKLLLTKLPGFIIF